MGAITLFVAFAAILEFGFGIAVFANNVSRKANQAFLIASTNMLLWMSSNVLILHTRDPEFAKVAMNYAYAVSAFIPTSFHLLRLAITNPASSWINILKKCMPHILAGLLISTTCFLPSFIKSISFPEAEHGISLATPEYGLPYILFNVYFAGAITFFAYCLYRDRLVLRGSQRIELEFLGFACIAGLVVGLVCGTIFAFLVSSSAPVPIAHAFSVLTLAAIVAYGISVHKILAVAVVLRTVTSYTLLTCFLVIVYLACWYTLLYIFKGLSITNTLPIHVITTLIVAFSATPARQKIQRAAHKLIAFQSTDIPMVIKAAGHIFQSVTTYNALLAQFSHLLEESFAASNSLILISDDSNLATAYSTLSVETTVNTMSITSALPELIKKTKEPVCEDSLIRTRPTKELKETAAQLEDLKMKIAIGFFSKSDLTGIVLLGARKGGRIYDRTEQDALQILCNQFSVALENAKLYTEVQDSKIRNEIMLDQLVSGVIVANPERKISLFNHEAQRITGIEESEAIGKDISELPRALCLALETTLDNKSGKRNIEAGLFEQDETRKSLQIRLGTTYLAGHDQKPMGALLVFTDMTELKTLEEQVRRSDQLSSVGTLAAGMAHEIKNPLVTIKTFTQLLPDRYAEEDFRNDFSSLVAHEVSRIDGIVNELLSFSKPTKPHLIPMNLHDVIGQILKLTHEQMSQRNIVVHDVRHASKNRILGDAKLLSQALINLTLNAIEAIGRDGKVTIGTINCTYRFASSDGPDHSITKECVRIQISDSGQGIEPNHIKKIFDPFFTNKSEGTGMGLSVAHGIIQEHHAVIEVESEIGKGSTFYIYVPVIEEAVA